MLRAQSGRYRETDNFLLYAPHLFACQIVYFTTFSLFRQFIAYCDHEYWPTDKILMDSLYAYTGTPEIPVRFRSLGSQTLLPNASRSSNGAGAVNKYSS